MKPSDLGAFEAKTHFSKILEKVREGRTFYITKRGRRIAELRPVQQPDHAPRFGCDKGRVKISEDFDAPIPGMEDYS